MTAASVAASSTARPSTTPISVGPVRVRRVGRRQRTQPARRVRSLGARRLRRVAATAHVGGQRREQRRRRGDAGDDDEQPDGERPAGMAGRGAAESLQHGVHGARSVAGVVGPRAELAPPPPGEARRAASYRGGSWPSPGCTSADLVGQDHGLHPVAQAELGEDVADVGLHGRLADDELGGDLAVGQPARHQLEHVALARRQDLQGVARRRRRRGAAPGEVLDEPARRATGPAGRRRRRRPRCRAAARPAGVSLSRKPLAPARSASKTYSSRSNVVTTRTRGAPSPEARIRRVASMPSSTGMRTSISTTSGRSAAAERDGLLAVGGLADDVDAVRLEDHPQPGPHEVLVVGDDDASASCRQPGQHGEPAARAGRRRQRPTERGDPLAHPDQPVPAASSPSAAPAPSSSTSTDTASSP